MNARYYLIISLIGLAVYILVTPAKVIDPLKNTSGESEVLAVKERIEEKKSTSADATTDLHKPPAENSNLSIDVQANKKTHFSQFLNMMSSCLDIKNSSDSSLAEPRIENLLTSVQNELGEPVIRSEDWTSTEIQTSSGEQRLIKIETSYENDDIVKKLKYFNMTVEGLMPIELAEDQATEPSATLIASLESEGKLLKKERSERIFFQNGEEIIYTEINGDIEFIELTRSGKTLRCKELSKAPCACQ